MSVLSLSSSQVFSDGVWDADEIQAVYGVHHVYSQKKSKVCLLKLNYLAPTGVRC